MSDHNHHTCTNAAGGASALTEMLGVMRDAKDVLRECAKDQKWMLIAPDGRVWINDNLMILSAALLAELGGYSEPLGVEFSKVLEANREELYESDDHHNVMCTPIGVQSGQNWCVIYSINQKVGRNMSDIPPPFSSEPPPKLLDQVRDRIRRLGYAKRTEISYVQWIKRYIHFHGKRHPKEMGKAEVEAFLTYLAVERYVAATTQNLALSAILFLYREILASPLPWLEDVARVNEPSRLLDGIEHVADIVGCAQRFIVHIGLASVTTRSRKFLGRSRGVRTSTGTPSNAHI